MPSSKHFAALACVLVVLAGLTACTSNPADTPASSADSASTGNAPAAAGTGVSPGDAAPFGAATSVVPEQATVASSEAAVDAGGRPVEAPQSLQAALGHFDDTDRVALEQLHDACAENRRCLEEVAFLANYVSNDCPHDSTCPKTLSGMLDPLDKAQKSGLVSLPESYPLASELRKILARATHDEARDEAGRSQPTPTPQPVDASDGTATPPG